MWRQFTLPIKYLSEWIRKVREFDALLAEMELWKGNWKYVTLLHEKSKEEIIILRSKLNKQRASVVDANFWNTKWKQSVIYYKAPNRQKVIHYVKNNDGLTGTLVPLRDSCDLLISSNSLHPGNVDAIPLSVMRWIADKFDKKEFKYKHDPKGKELWRSPEDTLKLKYGDCDDWGIFEYYMIRYIFTKLGVWEDVKHRLKCVDGHVFSLGTINKYAGRHFYLNWLYSDGNWMTVETTFYLNRAINNYGKKSQKFNDQYSLINYTFNEQFSWAQKDVVVMDRKYSKKFKRSQTN